MLNFDFHLESTPELDTLEVSLTKATTDFLAEKAKFDSLSAKARDLQKSDREAARKMATDVVKPCGEKCKELQLVVLGLEKRKRELEQQDVQMESVVPERGEVPKELEGSKDPEVPELPKVPEVPKVLETSKVPEVPEEPIVGLERDQRGNSVSFMFYP